MNKLMHALLITVASTSVMASPSDFDKRANELLAQHFNKYKDQEYFSGISLSIYEPTQPIKNYYIGNESHAADSVAISERTLFQIGSITKSFTSAIILRLEKANKLNINQTLKKWLPEYSKWADLSIKQILNMTSGLPNFTESPFWFTAVYEHPTRAWRNDELINVAYPRGDFNPPRKKDYFYSNTGYILADMIATKIGSKSFNEQMNDLIKEAGLTNTYYPIPVMDNEVFKRMAHGYNFNQYDAPPLLGQDVSNFNLTWASAAGAVVSNSEDIIKWVKALLAEDKLINGKQKTELTELNSTTTTKPIKKTTAGDSKAFALGVAQAYDKEMGNYWYYEGETLGFRAIYMYVPCNGVIISSIFNSATNNENDHVGELMKAEYKYLLSTNSALKCQS